MDLAPLERILALGPTPLFATVSGAHLYGFDSPDSDWDLRGAFVAPLREVLGLSPPEETVTLLGDEFGLDLDWVAHDVRKFARLMTRRNGYVLEQLYSPLVVHGGEWLRELREIGRGCIVRNLFYHYGGFFRGQRKLLADGEHTVKRLLYGYRVALTGIHVLRTGRVEANLNQLVAEYPSPGVEDLVARKRAGAEKGALHPGEAVAHTKVFDALEERLQRAFEESSLPETPTSRAALDDYVVRARLELGDG